MEGRQTLVEKETIMWRLRVQHRKRQTQRAVAGPAKPVTDVKNVVIISRHKQKCETQSGCIHCCGRDSGSDAMASGKAKSKFFPHKFLSFLDYLVNWILIWKLINFEMNISLKIINNMWNFTIKKHFKVIHFWKF